MTGHFKAYSTRPSWVIFLHNFPIAHSRRNVSVQSVWKIWVLRLTPHSESHAANPSSTARHLCIRKGQIHVKDKSFIWQPLQLWDWQDSSFFLSIHPPNSWFSFSFSLSSFLVLYAPLHHLTFFLLSLTPRLFFVFVCLVDLSEVLIEAGPVEHPVSLCLFLCFAFLILSVSNLLTKSPNNGKRLKTFLWFGTS